VNAGTAEERRSSRQCWKFLIDPALPVKVSTPALEIPIPVPTISGRFLAHAWLTPSQRAAIAAALELGELQIERYTQTQATRLTRADCVYARKARRATPAQRRQLMQGRGTIGDLGRLSKNGKANDWGSLTDNALEAAVRSAGVARVWDAIARIID
jgi:hypothetical protein